MSTPSPKPGQPLLDWSRRWLDPHVVRLIVEPATADLQHEWEHAPKSRRQAIANRGRWPLMRTVFGALAYASRKRLRQTAWPLMVLPVCLSVLGLFGLPSGLVTAHLAFAAIGVAVAMAIIASPLRSPTTSGRVAPRQRWWTLAIPLVLVLVALFGDAHEGVSAWARVGPLNVRVAMLVAPLFVLAMSVFDPSDGRRDLLGAACLGALLWQQDFAMIVLWGALFSVLASRPTRAVAIASVVALLALGFRHGTGAPVGLPAIGQVTARYGLPAITAFATIQGATIALLLRSHRRPTIALAVLLGAWPLVGPMFGEGFGLISFGGSVSVAMFASFGSWLRASAPPADPTPRSAEL